MARARFMVMGMVAVACATAAAPRVGRADSQPGAADGSSGGSLASSADGAAVAAPAERGGAQDQPKPYTVVRWDERYDYLRNPASRTDPLDGLKYIPLSDDGNSYLTLGGQLRERYEYFNNSSFGAGPQDNDGYSLFRFLPYADVHIGPYLRGFVQLRTADEAGREGGPRGRDMDAFDLQQGFLELDLPLDQQSSLALRAGRQQIVLGRERLIGISDFSNAQRNYDAFRATLNSPGNSLDLFWFRPVLVEKYEFDNSEGHTSFAGIYDTLALSGLEKEKGTLSLYGFALNVAGVAKWASANGGAAGDEDRYTIGSAFSVNPKPWDFDIEGDYQFGTFGNANINAFSIATEIGYTFENATFGPRPFLGFDLATGDHNPGNGHLGTFNQLFPSGHTYFGYMDFIGRQNIIDLHPGIELQLLKNREYAKKLALRSEYHQFWRESTHDAVYDAGGAVLRGTDGSGSQSIGGELDLLLNWQIDRHFSSYIGYSHFWPAGFIRDTGAHEQVDFFYIAAVYTF